MVGPMVRGNSQVYPRHFPVWAHPVWLHATSPGSAMFLEFSRDLHCHPLPTGFQLPPPLCQWSLPLPKPESSKAKPKGRRGRPERKEEEEASGDVSEMTNGRLTMVSASEGRTWVSLRVPRALGRASTVQLRKHLLGASAASASEGHHLDFASRQSANGKGPSPF